MPQRPLTNHVIIKLCKKLDNFRGVFLLNDLPKSRWRRELAVANLDTSRIPVGTHWVSWRKEGKTVFFVDPIGDIGPPTLLQKYFKGCRVFFNVTKLQRPGTTNCGQICVKFLHGKIV